MIPKSNKAIRMHRDPSLKGCVTTAKLGEEALGHACSLGSLASKFVIAEKN
jgi:hypothetical protein